jgi:hypothetical protein
LLLLVSILPRFHLFVFVVLGFELRALSLLYHLSHISSPFLLESLDCDCSTYPSSIPEITGALHTAWVFIGWDRVSWAFCINWPWASLLLISASWVARVRHYDKLFLLFSVMVSTYFFAVLGFELRVYTLSCSTSPFLWWVFWNKVSQTIFLDWLWNTILLRFASWVTGITGVSFWPS